MRALAWLYFTDKKLTVEGNFNSIYPRPGICLVFPQDLSPGWNCWQSLEADWNLILVVNNVASICRRTVIITHSDGVNIMSWQIMRTSLLFSQRITLGKSLEIPSPTTQP